MGTIVERKRKDGTTGYTAQILLKRDGVIAYRKAKTFDRRQAASAWLEKEEQALKKDGAIEAAQKGRPTLGDAVRRYVAESRKAIGKTKAQVLDVILKDPIASIECQRVRADDIVAFASRRGETAQPQTVMNYVSHLSAVFAVARPAWGYELNQQAMKDAQAVGRQLGLTSSSRKRDRRPTFDELDKLLSHFEHASVVTPRSVPMHKLVVFALFSARRQEEIVTIKWADLEVEHKRVLVRDMKHPGQKIGNDTWCDLPDQALRVIAAMPVRDERIFPYSTDAVGARFTRACQFLEIKDLHFHDLRHEGVSRLFEMGLNIPHVAAVSGHRSWSSLKRYAHVRQSGDKYDGWPWLDRVTEPLRTN